LLLLIVLKQALEDKREDNIVVNDKENKLASLQVQNISWWWAGHVLLRLAINYRFTLIKDRRIFLRTDQSKQSSLKCLCCHRYCLSTSHEADAYENWSLHSYTQARLGLWLMRAPFSVVLLVTTKRNICEVKDYKLLHPTALLKQEDNQFILPSTCSYSHGSSLCLCD